MRITKTEIKNCIEGKDQIATYYGGLVGLGLEVYDLDNSEEAIYFVEVAGAKRPRRNRKSLSTMTEEAASVGDIGLSGWTNV